ncbi:hypothetical protein O181_065106 [Austropuccinia psidii MF-1]|uniref:Uncharacterized protein n=1 Tax=Austropuccinia psidii MF-1 TaxID=1389203 RepID=A0A9Q3ENB1_9BASI|nr:hypothetical protein [Austropuccinia psidii MF-1]
MSSAPSSLHSTPSNTEPPTNDSIQPTRQSWVWVYCSNVDDQYVQCQYAYRFGKTCNKRLKRDRTGSTKGMSQHLHLLHHVDNPKSVSSPLSKSHTLDQPYHPNHKNCAGLFYLRSLFTPFNYQINSLPSSLGALQSSCDQYISVPSKSDSTLDQCLLLSSRINSRLSFKK